MCIFQVHFLCVICHCSWRVCRPGEVCIFHTLCWEKLNHYAIKLLILSLIWNCDRTILNVFMTTSRPRISNLTILLLIIIPRTISMVLPSAGSRDECSTEPSGRTFGPSRPAWAISSPKAVRKLHPTSPFIIIQPEVSINSFYYPTKGRRLIRPKLLVIYRDDVPARRQSPIQVLTGPGVE